MDKKERKMCRFPPMACLSFHSRQGQNDLLDMRLPAAFQFYPFDNELL